MSTLSDSAESTEFLFLSLFTIGSSSIYSFATFLAFLGPLAGITLGFDAVGSERSQGTLNRLASQPIYRDSIINAKFLAGASVIALTVAFLGLYLSGAGILLTGVVPSGEEIARIIAFLILAVVYISFWLALSYPLEGIEGFANILPNYELTLALNRISPYYLFSEAASTILNPGVRSIGVVTTTAYSGAVASSLSFGQSLLLIWPHLVVMVALVIAGFAIAYINFMRQEIRA